MEEDFMIERCYKGSVSLDSMLDTNSTAGSDSEKSRTTRKKNRWQPCTVSSRLGINGRRRAHTSKKWSRDSSGHLERLADKGITNLPNELIVKILSNLDIKDISVCRRVNSSWQALVDTSHLQVRSFSRRLRFQPISQTVENYHSFTRGWLASFSNIGKKLAKRQDKFLGNKHFSEILFFNIAKVLAKTKLLTCQNVCTVKHPEDVYINPIFSPEGSHLVTVHHDGIAKIWELVAGQLQHKATISSYRGLKVSFSPDGSHLVTVSNDHTAEIWGLVAGQWQHKATIRHSKRVRDISFSPDGSQLVTASDDGTAKIWVLAAGQWQEKTTIKHSGTVKSASFSPDGSHLVTASGRTAKIWRLDAEQWQHKATIEHSEWMDNASFSLDGNQIVTTSTSDNLIDHTTKIWERVDGQWREKVIGMHACPGRGISFSPDGSHLVITLEFNITKVLERVDGRWREKAAFPFCGPISKASFSPDGSHLVTVYFNKAIIWGLVGGQWKVKTILQHTHLLRSASFGPDGIHLLTLSGDNITKIWLLTGC